MANNPAQDLVLVDTVGPAAVIRLNRPQRHNALVPELLDALEEAMASALVQQSPCLVLAANGRSFSTGGDLRGFWDHRTQLAAYAQRLVGQLNRVVMALHTHNAPVACAVQGPVTGGSLGLLLGCDRVFMARTATVAPWYATVGFSPDGGWTALLPGLIGERHTLAWLADDDTKSADACHALGLAHTVTDGDPLEAALDWARPLADRNAASIRNARRLVRAPAEDIARRLEAELRAFVRQVQAPEAMAGMARFLGEDPA